MHSFAHQYECQVVNNPRYNKGLGLFDGEGTERLWSRMMGLIGITRNLSVCGAHLDLEVCVGLLIACIRLNQRNRRKMVIERQLTFIGTEMRDGLGAYLTSKLRKNVPENEIEAAQGIGTSGMAKADLKVLWEEHKTVQLSVRSRALGA